MYWKSILCLAVLSTMVGCTASVEPSEPVTTSSRTVIREDDTAQLAAYAATAQLPENAVYKSDLSVGAIVDRDGRIHIYNFTDKPLAAGNIWVNREYVQRFDGIPARAEIILARNRFFNHQGDTLVVNNARVQSVDLQWDRDVHSLLGPVIQ
jgi:hypothetical protein